MTQDQINQRLQYLSRQGVICMNRIEDSCQKMMSEINPELESSWFQALDDKDIKRLNSLYNQLTKLVDESEGN
jgi:hypothetical protein